MGFFDKLFKRGDIDVREARFAGEIYPEDARELARRVRTLVDAAASEADADTRALLVPHAAYEVAGTVMAEAYRAASGWTRALRRVVVVGTSRLVPFRGIALDAWDGFETPLGILEYPRDGFWDDVPDDATCRRMAAAFDPEESIEAQLPFIQEVFDGVELVPVLVGDASSDDVLSALRWLVGPDTLLVLSANLSHDVPAERAAQLDAQTEQAIAEAEADKISLDHTTGRTALRATIAFAREQGWTPRCLARSNSHEQGGSRDEVVGYGVFAWRA